jgi:arylsulfatase A-like enzyme
MMTLATVLKNAGYTIIHVGKGHVGPVGYEGAEPLNLGFEVNIAGANVGTPRSYYGKTRYGIDARDFSPHARPIPGLEKYHGTDTFLTEALTLEAKAEIDKALTKKKPIFLYMSHYPHLRGVGKGNDYVTLHRRGKWKIIYNYLDASNRCELYDLENDPDESDNLAASNPEKLRDMMQAMVRELESMNALYPVKDAQPLKPAIGELDLIY